MLDIATQWRDHLLKIVEPHKNVPNCLSGGMDSGTLLAAQLACGGHPNTYTFYLEGHKSADYKVAQSMAAHFGLPFQAVEIKRESLLPDVRHIIREFGTSRKTHVQCIHPLLYVSDMMVAQNETQVMLGTGGIVEDNRKCAQELHYHGEDAARKIRRSNLLDITGSATEKMHMVFKKAKIEVVEPYSTQPFADWHLALTMKEINRPKQKGIALRAFPEFWKAGGWYRKNSSLQVGTGIREWHDTLLTTYNASGYRSVVGIYNLIKKGSKQ